MRGTDKMFHKTEINADEEKNNFGAASEISQIHQFMYLSH